MSKIYDAQIEALNEAFASGDIKLYNELKEERGFQEIWEIEQDKELSLAADNWYP